MLKAGAVIAAVAAMATAAVESMPDSTSIWPITVAGWVALGLSFASTIGVIYTLHRFSLKPLEKEVADSRHECAQDIKSARDHFDESIMSTKKYIELEMNNFREAVNRDLSGFSRNQERQSREIMDLEAVTLQFTKDMTESKENRKYLTTAIERILLGLDQDRRDRILHERQVLAMIADLKS